MTDTHTTPDHDKDCPRYGMADGVSVLSFRCYCNGQRPTASEPTAVVQLSTSNCWCKPVILDDHDVCTTCGHQWTFGGAL